MPSTFEIGTRLVTLCQAGKFIEAIDELYADGVVSDEPGAPEPTAGRDAVRAKNEAWFAGNEVHSISVDGPWPHGDRFAVRFDIDITPKAGPMAGQRFQMSEIALYTVADGKIAREEFFYHMG